MNLLKQIGLRAVKKMSDYPKDWEEVRLDNIANIFDNLRVPVSKDKRTVGNIPYYGANGIQDYVSGYTHDGEFVLLAEDGANSLIDYPITYTKGKIWVNNHAHVLSGKNGITNTNFLSYLLKKVNYEEILVGGTRLKLNGKILRNINIYLPALPEQKAIADTLLTFDKHIEHLEKLNEKKKMIRDGTLEDLMSGKRRLDGFNGEWEEKELNRICDIYDGTHQTPIYKPNGIRFVSVENIKCLKESDKYISKSDFKRDFKIYPEKNDVLMTRIGDIGTAAIIKDNEKLAYYVSLALFKNIKIDSSYLYHHIGCNHFKDELDKRILHHAVPKKINKNDIGKCKVIYPTDIKEQEAIAAILTSMDAEIEDLEKEKAKIENLKAGAMDDLLNGRVRLI